MASDRKTTVVRSAVRPLGFHLRSIAVEGLAREGSRFVGGLAEDPAHFAEGAIRGLDVWHAQLHRRI